MIQVFRFSRIICPLHFIFEIDHLRLLTEITIICLKNFDKFRKRFD